MQTRLASCYETYLFALPLGKFNPNIPRVLKRKSHDHHVIYLFTNICLFAFIEFIFTICGIKFEFAIASVFSPSPEGPEWVKWELGLACFCSGKMGFESLGPGFTYWDLEKKVEMGMGNRL